MTHPRPGGRRSTAAQTLSPPRIRRNKSAAVERRPPATETEHALAAHPTSSPLFLRLATLLFPPLGLLLLWRSSQRVTRKLLGTAGILLFSLLYAGLIIFVLIRFTGLEVEWRGGYMPALTYHKASP